MSGSNPSRGVASSLLTSESMTKTVKKKELALFDTNPLLKLYKRETYASSRILIEIEENLRKIVAIHANPTTGDRVEYTQIGDSLAKVMYASQTFNLDSETMAGIRLLGEAKSANMFSDDIAKRAQKWLNKQRNKRIAAIMRTKHLHCAGVLQQAIYNMTVDGITVPLDFGLDVRNTGVLWSGAGNDIITDWEDMLYQFRKKAGRNPTHVIYGAGLRKKYLITNNDIRSQLLYTPALSAETMLQDMLLKMVPSTKQISVEDVYLNDAEAEIDVWNDKYICMLADDGDTLELATSRTIDNSYKGGMAASTVHMENPGRVEVTISDNFIPIVRNSENIITWDVLQTS